MEGRESEVCSGGHTMRTSWSSSTYASLMLTSGSIPRSSDTAGSKGRRPKVMAIVSDGEGKPAGLLNGTRGVSRMTVIGMRPSAAGSSKN